MTRRRRGCLSTKTLLQLLRGKTGDARKAVVESHLALCASCRGVGRAAAEAIALGVSTYDLRGRIEEAARFVSEIEQQPSSHAMRQAIANSEMGSDRYVSGRLLERSREEFAREPRKSLTLASAAIWVAERAASPVLQFTAWLDCSSIRVRLGQFGEAWDAIDRAGSFVADISEREHAQALLLYAKAYVGSQPDVWEIDAALAWTDEADRIFMRTDQERLRSTADMRAYLHYCRGEHAAAVEICRKLWEDCREAALALNFASYLIEYGDASAADNLLDWAHSQIHAADRVTVARHAGIQGRSHAAQHEWRAASDAFSRAVQGYRAVGMDDSAIRVELSRIRCAKSAAPVSNAVHTKTMADLRAVIAASAELDRREPTRRRRFTVEALEYLRELDDASALTLEAFRHVEVYLDAIARGPARAFVRPFPARVM